MIKLGGRFDQILAKLSIRRVGAAHFSSRRPENFENEKVSSALKLLKLTWGVTFGSRRTVLDIKTHFLKVKPLFPKVHNRI